MPRTSCRTCLFIALAIAIGAGAAVAASATVSPRSTVTASVLRARPTAARRGSVVPSSDVFGNRVFPTARQGFALANEGNAQYPALSTDAGHTWRIDGPQFHVDAADGPEGVGSVGATGSNTLYAYGSSVVDVSTDRGRVWREAFLGGLVMAVVPGQDNHLVAFVEQSVTNARTNPVAISQYVTRDGGRHWELSNGLGGA